MVRYCDEFESGFGWIGGDPAWLERCAHALRADGAVWVVDPFEADGVEERIRALGEPAAVVQLLDRHARDCRAVAARLGVPLHETPFDGLPGSPFEVIPIRRGRLWREVALWWAQERVLVCADALAAAPAYRAPGEALGVHPLLRLRPPRRLARLEPAHVLTGHGEGIHGDAAAAALHEALATARRRLPRYLAWAFSFQVLRRGR